MYVRTIMFNMRARSTVVTCEWYKSTSLKTQKQIRVSSKYNSLTLGILTHYAYFCASHLSVGRVSIRTKLKSNLQKQFVTPFVTLKSLSLNHLFVFYVFTQKFVTHFVTPFVTPNSVPLSKLRENYKYVTKKSASNTYIGIPIFCIYLLPIYGFSIIVFYIKYYSYTYKYCISSYSTMS